MTPRAPIPAHIHGTSLHYAKLGCHDPACVALNTATRASLRRKRYAEREPDADGNLVHPDAPHGTEGGYTNYGCRCPLCQEAGHSAAARRRENGS